MFGWLIAKNVNAVPQTEGTIHKYQNYYLFTNFLNKFPEDRIEYTSEEMDCLFDGYIYDKSEVVAAAKLFAEDGFKLVATSGNYDLLTAAGLEVTKVKKLYEGRPNITDMITNGDIQLIINSPVGKDSVHDDSYLRKAAIKAKVPYFTTVAAAIACAEGIHYVKTHGQSPLKSLQELHAEIKDK